jgi:hypothetical protein
MNSLEECREYARECMIAAENLSDAPRKEIMIEIAKLWMEAAMEMEHRVRLSIRIFRQARRKSR